MNELRELLDELQLAYEEIKLHVRNKDKFLYKRWKAGGFIIDENIISMYPNVVDVVDTLCAGEDDQEDEDDD